MDANSFQSAEWGKAKGLYADIFENVEALDEGVMRMADYLLSTNPEAQSMLKKVFWENCSHWDELLETRAEASGKLVLSDYTKEALKAYS
jgi:methylglutaconyl-CoA hydratase